MSAKRVVEVSTGGYVLNGIYKFWAAAHARAVFSTRRRFLLIP